MADNLTTLGSVYDIQSSIKCSWEYYTVEDFEFSLAYENKHYKRSSVIKLFESAIKKKKKEVGNE